MKREKKIIFAVATAAVAMENWSVHQEEQL